MSKKSISAGGKKDEIIYTAMALFFEKGYEATSVRMILDKVQGEVGMFYHYFKSKEELFQTVVERFFTDYKTQLAIIIDATATKEEVIENLLTHYQESIRKFQGLSENIHWTIQYAMSAKTVEEMKPVLIKAIEKWNTNRLEPVELIAGQILYAISATLHSDSFPLMSETEKKNILIDLLNRLL